MSASPPASTGNFVPESYVVPEEKEQLLEFLKRTLEEHSRFINRKDMGQYEIIEVQNNQTFPGATPQAKRFIYRKVLIFGALAAGGIVIVPHGVVGITDFTRMYGTFITGADNRPLPYVDAAAVTNQVSMLRLGANVVVTNGATAPAIVSGRIIIEFMKN